MIVVLGNENDKQGNLSPVAVERCKAAIALWQAHQNQKVVTTGDYGAHFNLFHSPHSVLLKQYLTDNGGIPEGQISTIKSMTTYQDILGLRRLLVTEPADTHVYIVTSDFHYGRVKFYCDLILHLQDPKNDGSVPVAEKIEIVRANSGLDEATEKTLMASETAKMNKLLGEFPGDVYKNASDEQKHYDNVSIAMITGQFASFALGYQYFTKNFNATYSVEQTMIGFKSVFNGTFFELHNGAWFLKSIADALFMLGYAVPLFLIITLFWVLYKRAAHTARLARMTMRVIESSYSQFGFSLYYSTGRLRDMFFTFKRMLECIYLLMGIMIFGQVSFFLLTALLIAYYIFAFDKNDK